MAKEKDKILKLTAYVFINALLRVLGLPPGIVGYEFQELFDEAGNRTIMDFIVFTKMGYYIIFEFHSKALTEKMLLRDFKYLALQRERVEHPVDMIIISTERIIKSVQKVKIMPDWDFEPKFLFLIKYDAWEIINNIKNKVENNEEVTDDDAYMLSVLPFTKYEESAIDFLKYLCHFVNEIEMKEEYKYIIKTSQILCVELFISDEKLEEELMDVIKMKSTFLRRYEENLVKDAITDNTEKINYEHAIKMKELNISREDILEVTKVDIDKI